MGIKTVAVYSTADKARFAARKVRPMRLFAFGPPPSRESYLNMANILRLPKLPTPMPYTLQASRRKPSSPKFAASIKSNSSGHRPRWLTKWKNSKTMKTRRCACIPGGEGLLASAGEGKELAKEIKYRLLLKPLPAAVAGHRIIWKEEGFSGGTGQCHRKPRPLWQRSPIWKKYIEARHIEIQIGNQYGKACHLSERDCSIQRRHQNWWKKPSPFMTPELRDAMGEAAVKSSLINKATKGWYRRVSGWQTPQLLFHGNEHARIQVEHPITEEVINYDLIREQILVAAVPISGKIITPTARHWMPYQCRKSVYELPALARRYYYAAHPGGHGVRVDSACVQWLPHFPNYDSMVGNHYGGTNPGEEAIAKMHRALSEYVIEG